MLRLACRFNRTVPDLVDQRHVLLWQRLESAKHRVVRTLLSLGLPIRAWSEEAGGLGLTFSTQANVLPTMDPVVRGPAGDRTIPLDVWRRGSGLRRSASAAPCRWPPRLPGMTRFSSPYTSTHPREDWAENPGACSTPSSLSRSAR